MAPVKYFRFFYKQLLYKYFNNNNDNNNNNNNNNNNASLISVFKKFNRMIRLVDVNVYNLYIYSRVIFRDFFEKK